MSSVAHRHAEWLSLLEISGPFLSMRVLLKAFPQGLDAHDSDHAQLLRTYYDEWVENQESNRPDAALHRAWIDFVLKETLGFTDDVLLAGQRIPETLSVFVALENETLRPDLVLVNPAGSANAGTPRLLIQILPISQGVEKSMEGHRWKASPASRMLELLKATNTRVGLITNGEHWMLVNAPQGESTGYITWTADLWVDEPVTLQAFRSLLSLRRFFGVDASQTLESMLNESLDDQQEVTDQLGYQVRRAVEVLIQAFDRIDQDRNRELLSGVSATFLYEAALTVMMRLVFLLSAEERGLFMLGEEMYDQHYAVSTLRAQLRETADQHGEEVLSRRSDAWCRLLATFRAVYGGVEHDALRLPPYGGNLFDPDRFPFLEGRATGTHFRDAAADPLPINNQIVLHLLEALQILRVKVPGGPPEPRRLSFSALGVEQIGHVYEGLLDHTAVRATSPVLGLAGSKKQESEIELSELQRLKERGEAELLEHLKSATGRQATALKRALDSSADNTKLSDQIETQRLLQACNNDADLCERIQPFAKLLRLDTMDFPVVINAGSLYVTTGSERRSSGTYYTPPSLTEPIVKYALDPLVYIGPVEGLPETEWKLRSAKEILDLKVCDMAMGSGAFLVQVCRYLAEKLVEAWSDAEARNPGAFVVTPDGDLSTGSAAERLLPADADERILIARRYVADKCIYGVDKNDLAVNMAKLSLWLVTLQRDRPFTFLDHALKRGDSLLGVSTLKQIENFSLRPDISQITFGTANLFRYVEEAANKRRELEDVPSNNYGDIETKNRLHAEAEATTAKVKAIADRLIAFELQGLKGDAYDQERIRAADEVELLMKRDADRGIDTTHPDSELASSAPQNVRGRQPFHWPVEFPEVFACGGFTGVVGNPPYRHGSRISTDSGTDYLRYLISHNAGLKGTSDLVVYFVRRSLVLLKRSATFGLVVTKSIAEGDNKRSGLGWLLANSGLTIYRAIKQMPWPGKADLLVSVIHACNDDWRGQRILDGKPTSLIGEALEESHAANAELHPLKVNDGLCYKGSELLGEGFIVSEAEAQQLLVSSSAEVVKQLVNGKEFSSMPDFKPIRWVLDFGEMTEAEARRYTAAFAIVEERVKPARATDNRRARRERFWRFGEIAKGLYTQLIGCERAIARLFTCEYWFWDFLTPGPVFTNALVVVADGSDGRFAVLTSSLHEAWAGLEASSLVTRFRYTPSRCFETFPFPLNQEPVCVVGKRYQELRRQVMLTRWEGLTKTYSRFHDRRETDADIARLRALHTEMDQAVTASYGWGDLDLNHGFRVTKQGERFTISESARREVLNRLLELNHERYAEEERLGLHDKKRGKATKKGKSVAANQEADGQVKLQLSS